MTRKLDRGNHSVESSAVFSGIRTLLDTISSSSGSLRRIAMSSNLVSQISPRTTTAERAESV